MPQYSRADILNQNTNDFPNNNSGQITPAILRDYNRNVADSVVFIGEAVSSSLSASYAATASFARTASYALNATQAANATTASYAITAQNAITANTANVALYANNAGNAVNADTASIALNADSASFAQVSISSSYSNNSTSASYALTASFALNGGGGTVNTGSFVTTSSFNAYTASTNTFTQSIQTQVNNLQAATSSYITSAQTSSMSVLSASYAITASFLQGTIASASYALNATSASFANTATSASFASNSTSASYALNATSASNANLLDGLDSTAFVLNSQTSSMSVGTASLATSASYALTASFAANVPATSSFAISASYALNATSASYALNSTSASFAQTAISASFAPSTPAFPFTGSALITGSLGVTGSITTTGNITARGTNFSVGNANNPNTLFSALASGSSAFEIVANGNLPDSSFSLATAADGIGTNFHRLNIQLVPNVGITFGDVASGGTFTANSFLKVDSYASTPSIPGFTRGLSVTGSLNAPSITGSLLGTASYASNALSASYALNATSASYALNATTSSFASTIASGLNITASNILVNNNLVVNGTASFAYTKTVTGSAVIVGDAFIILNADTPTAPYAGIMVYDTGSASTASFEWNGNNDYWITVEETGASAGILTGASGSKGSEVFPTANRLTKGTGNNTILDSNITDNGSTVSINSNTLITGSLNVTAGITGSLFGTASFALNGGVTQILAGPNITVSPLSGRGQVTISSTGAGTGSFNTATGSYGSFYDTTIQTNPVANVPRSMSFNETAITNGVSISGSTDPFNTYIKTENAGIYNLQFSAQVDKTDSGTDEIDIWLRKNGIDLIDTATKLTLTNNNTKVVAAWNWFVQSAANDYYQLIWSSADTDMRLFAEASSSLHPGIPSVIATANRVDQFLSNTGSFSGSFNGVFTGSLQGTASWASNAVSSSFALSATSASYALSSTSASYALNSTSASFADNSTSASYSLNSTSASYSVNSTSASYALDSTSASFAQTAISASFAPTVATFPFTGSAIISGSLEVTGTLGVSSLITGRSGLTLTGSLNSSGQATFNSRITIDDSVGGAGSGLLVRPFVFSGTTASYTQYFTEIAGTSAGGGNVYMGSTPTTATGSVVITGSNNIFNISTLTTNAIAAGGRRTGFSGRTNIINAIPTYLGTFSASLFPTINNSWIQIAPAFQFNHPTATTTTNNSVFAGTSVAVTMASGSINFTNANINSNLTVTNRWSGSTVAFSNVNTVGTLSVTTVDVPVATGTPAIGMANGFYGGSTTFHLQSGSSGGGFVNSVIVGNNLVVTGSAFTTAGQVAMGAFGDWNTNDGIINDAGKTKFLVGTGTATGARRTSFYVSASGLTVAQDSLLVTGSLTVGTATPELQVLSTGVTLGNILSDIHTVTGSLGITGSLNAANITGSLLGTASFANTATSASFATTSTSASFASTSISASYALTASYAANAGSGGVAAGDIYSYTFLLMGA